MDHYGEIADYTRSIIKNAIEKNFSEMPSESYEKQYFHFPGVKTIKMDLLIWQIYLAARIHIAKNEEYDVDELFPIEYGLYNLMMQLMPNVVEQVALINKYVNSDTPPELILPLVKDATKPRG